MIYSGRSMEKFLASVALFSELDCAQLARIARGCSEFRIDRGSAAYRRGDPCTGLHVVASGQVKVSLHTSRGDAMVVELALPGMTFGKAPLFSGRPHLATAEALVDSVVLHVPKKALLREADLDPRFARRLITALGNRLYQRVGEFEHYVLASGTERVADYLLRGANGEARPGSERVTFSANKGIIASRLNLTHEHFSRILREFMGEGLIEVSGREVRILDRKRLSRHAPAHARTGPSNGQRVLGYRHGNDVQKHHLRRDPGNDASLLRRRAPECEHAEDDVGDEADDLGREPGRREGILPDHDGERDRAQE